jgi:glutathionylspermidine synthase
MEDEERTARGRWAEHDVTRHMRGQAEKSVEHAQQNLHAMCSKTTDPMVAAAYANYLAMMTFVSMLSPEKRKQ